VRYQNNAFDAVFKLNREILLKTEGLDVGQLYIMKIGSDNNLLFLDARGCQLLQFSQNGQFLKKIGERGQGPGEYNKPYGLAVDSQGNIIVSDLETRRMNLYDKEGSFLSSFICTGIHWVPHIICVNSKGQYFLGGYKMDPEKMKTGNGMFINKYDSNGKYITSFYPRNTNQTWLLSIFPFFYFDLDEEDKIYATQLNKYEISIYDSGGTLLETIGKSPSHFKPLDSSIEVDYSKFKNPSELKEKLAELSRSWTKILSIRAIGNRYLLIELETNNLITGNDMKYALDILNKKGQLIAGGIQTDFRLLCTDKEGYVYFLMYTDEEEVIEKAPQYKIGKFSLKIEH